MQQEYKIPGQEPRPEASQHDNWLEPILPEPQNMLSPSSNGFAGNKKKTKGTKKLALTIIALLLSLVIAIAVAAGWLFSSLNPPDASAQPKRVIISQGASLAEVSRHLEQEGIIKNATAFEVYIRMKGLQGKMQAGIYTLSPSQSAQEVIEYIVAGKVESLIVTIFPGKTLAEIADDLEGYGFERAAITSALSKQYDHPLLSSKPPEASLEGYVFPDTYNLGGDGSIDNLLIRSFDKLYEEVQSNGIDKKLSDRGLSLHQGITMASIIQKEVSGPEDQKQVAQIIYKRLKDNIALGMDSTSVYAAKQRGDNNISTGLIINIESAYNTRTNKGLPPGPIANFNLSALVAVANPAPGDFLYFVSGDDGANYFSRTLKEHEENTKKYCTQQCR